MAACEHVHDGDGQLLRGIGFEHIASCPNAHGLSGVGGRGFDGEKNYVDMALFEERGSRLKASHEGHAEVRDYQIGHGGSRGGNEGLSIANSSYDVVALGQQITYGEKEFLVIVSEQNAFANHKISSVRRTQNRLQDGLVGTTHPDP